MPRLALTAAALLVAAPSAARLLSPRFPRAPRPCAHEGRGEAPRHWVGCAGDSGPPRVLEGAERLALELPLELNRATAADLASVPGMSAKLAEQVVADRRARGPFETLEALERVRGIGPARLARSRPYLTVGLSADEDWAARRR